MKLKTVFALAASLSLVAGNALAADNTNSQRYKKNSSQAQSQQHQVKARASDHFARIVDMKYDQKQREDVHPIHQTRMGNR